MKAPPGASFGQSRGVPTGLWLLLAAGLGVSLLPGVSLAGHLGGLGAGLLQGSAVGVRRTMQAP